MEYLKYLSRPYSKYISVGEWEKITGSSMRTNTTFERECEQAFRLANDRRRPSEFLTAAFPTPPSAQIADSDLYLLGGGACTIPLHADNRQALSAYLEGEDAHIRTNRGTLPASLIRNRMGLRRVLEATRPVHMLFNGF